VDAGGGHTATTAADGSYTIAGLPAGTYTVTPSKDEHVFAPASRSVTVGPSATGKDFTATRKTYSASGKVTVGGVGVGGVTVDAGGGRTATTAADGTYTITGLVAGNYTVTAAKSGYTVSPASRAVAMGPDASGVDFTLTLETFSISGRITAGRLGLAGATVTASDGAGHVGSAVTATDGSYVISGLVASRYTITPAKAGYRFIPISRSVTVGPNATGKNFLAWRSWTRSFGGGWALFSVPLAPEEESAGQIFGDTTQAAVTWDPAQAKYVAVTGKPVLGRGYWFKVRNTSQTAEAYGAAAEGDSYEVALERGWQILGNPFDEAIDWSTTEVRIGSAAAIPLAQASGVCSYAWVYNNQTQSFALVDSTIPGAYTSIEAWEGFFIYAESPMTLILHRSTASATGRRASVPMLRAESGGFTFGLSARCGSASDDFNVLGVGPASGTASGGMTVQEPPQLSGGVTLSLLSPESGAPCAVDVRSKTNAKDEWQWKAIVRTDTPNSDVVVLFDDLRGLPREYEAVLTDVDANKSVYLRTSPMYTFRSGADGAERHLVISVRRSVGGLHITAMRADAVRSGGASIAYMLSASARVSMRVLNAAGRVVALPSQNVVQAAGAQTLSWNGRAATGSQVPAGMYTVELEAVTEAGERARAVSRVMLGR